MTLLIRRRECNGPHRSSMRIDLRQRFQATSGFKGESHMALKPRLSADSSPFGNAAATAAINSFAITRCLVLATLVFLAGCQADPPQPTAPDQSLTEHTQLPPPDYGSLHVQLSGSVWPLDYTPGSGVFVSGAVVTVLQRHDRASYVLGVAETDGTGRYTATIRANPGRVTATATAPYHAHQSAVVNLADGGYRGHRGFDDDSC